MSVNPVSNLNSMSSDYCMTAGVRNGMVYSGNCSILVPSSADPGLHASILIHVCIINDGAVFMCLQLICGICLSCIHNMSSVTKIHVKPWIANDWALSYVSPVPHQWDLVRFN